MLAYPFLEAIYAVMFKRKLHQSILPLFLGSWLSISAALSQTPLLPLTPLPLQDLSAFRPVTTGWSVVGAVEMDLNQNRPIKTKPGQGILVHADADKEPLLMNADSRDMLVQLDFMLPQGGQSALYLQGRYGLLLNDSWGHAKPTATDCGALEGRMNGSALAPRQNVCRAPGLWQTLMVDFQGPRFDEHGRKVQNARFLKVILNGVTVHENIEVTGTTQGALFPDEKATGPLAFVGKSSPVAIRNIQYENYENLAVKVSDMRFQLVEGKFKEIEEMKGKAAIRQGPTAEINWEAGSGSSDYALTFTGNLSIPKTGKYAFAVQCNGAAQLSIDGKTIIQHNGENGRHIVASGTTDLTAATHTFTLTYAKNHWRPSVLGFFVAGQGMKPMALHADRSFPDAPPVGAIGVEATHEPAIVRSFLQFGDKKRTHCLSVGDPSGTHYTVDLNQGALLQAWKGGFLNTTDMWHERGEPQLAFPTGSVITLPGQFPLARLQNDKAQWPASVDWEKELIYKGYTINPQGRPLFRYTYQGIGVTDEMKPELNGRELSRTIQLANHTNKGLFCRVASGKTISPVGKGLYQIDDHAYLVRLDEKKMGKPSIREVEGHKELLLPLKAGDQTIAYSIIW